jgi:hypothetical protein
MGVKIVTLVMDMSCQQWRKIIKMGEGEGEEEEEEEEGDL